MYTLEAILEKLRAYMPVLQKKYPVSRLGVFGSYARGEAAEDSDIDVAVELNGPMGLNFVAMANEIEDLFEVKVDVVPKRSIKPSYLASVEREIFYMSRQNPLQVVVSDIFRCIEHIEGYTATLSFDDFSTNFMVIEACLYNIQIIGEAVNQLADDIKAANPQIPWALIKGMQK